MSLYTKDIHRPIDGVIKSNKLEQEAIQTELEEYVITRELGPYFAHFYDRYVRAIEEPTDNMGVWISGFFGSGKSHFLKVLSLLLDNKEVMGKRALEYFRGKVEDSLLFANMQRASDVTHGEVILFNIDSKADADSKRDKEAIVKVFMKVFDEHLGYFGSSPEIADFERRLDKQGKYDAFKEAYQTHSSLDWVEDRENWDFREDYILAALQDTLAMSREAAQSFFDKLEGNYSLSVDKFAKIIYDYVATKPAKHRLVFMVDEVGQYIGENPDLMLNLQTVAEDLGTRCGGRAWICVTSQEDIDSITKNRVRGNDFS
ncbi:MAG: BREX system P-loop protein BrxC, partial [Trueperaceae bacterium]|nr:BREX system P-loop protein BrxC [Trueperaceae bacterium]